MSKRHEKLLFRYSSALERGDFQVVADVLHEAERDPALEQMILDLNDAHSAERFNHMNPKEIPMIAALYQNPKPTPRYRWQGLPFVAALAVIALLTVMLAVQTTRGNNPMSSGNSGGNDVPAAAQISPYCTGTLISTFTSVPLHSRPGADAPVVAELRYDNNAGREIVVLDVATVDGEVWVFVRVPSSPDVPFGWTTEAQLRMMVADCQPTLVPVEAAVQASTVVPPVVTATPIPAIAQHPLLIVTLPSAGSLITVVPESMMPISIFTPTPVPMIAEPLPLPTVVSPSAATQGVSVAATDLARFGEGGFCKMTTLTTAAMYVLPEWHTGIVVALPENTVVTVGDFVASTDPQGNPLRWYVVGFEDVRGWMPASQLDTSTCPAIADTSVAVTQIAETRLYLTATAMIQMATALPPTIVPPAQDAAATGERFMPVYVQPGDTLISVLRRFNIDLDRIPELMRINNLTDNSIVTGSAELPPGTILLVPLPNLGSLLTCTLSDQEHVDVLTEDAEFAEVVMTLQAGDSLDMFTQPIGDWYAAIVHQDGMTMSSVYVRIHDIEQLANCQPVTTAAADMMPVPLVITATLVPFGDEPTALPPTVVPPERLVTATPIPTPTPIR